MERDSEKFAKGRIALARGDLIPTLSGEEGLAGVDLRLGCAGVLARRAALARVAPIPAFPHERLAGGRFASGNAG